ADHRAQIPRALSVGDWRSAARSRRERGEKGAAPLHHRRWLRHHTGLPALFAAVDRRRGLPALPARPAGLREACGQQRAEAPEATLCGMICPASINNKPFVFNKIILPYRPIPIILA